MKLIGLKPGYIYHNINQDNKYYPYYQPTYAGWIDNTNWNKIQRFQDIDLETNFNLKDLKSSPKYKELKELISYQKSTLYQFNMKSILLNGYIRGITELGNKRFQTLSLIDILIKLPYYILLCKYYNYHIHKYSKNSKYWY